ncbi:hypothetical protein [Nocardioides montaniterrae]
MPEPDLTTAEALLRLGGVAARREVLAVVSRASLERAVELGEVVRVARGRYALPGVDGAIRAAHAVRGVLCLESAALALGWAVKTPPPRPRVAVPKHRRVPARGDIDLHWVDLLPEEHVDGRTTTDRTLVDCLRLLDFPDALAVADSALRSGYSATRLRAICRDLRGPGSKQARRVAAVADGRAANPFESALRAIALDVPGLAVVPQVGIRQPHFLGRPDLVDEALGMALEADSFEWHGDRAALARDARRYDELVVNGWLVLRFAWEDVMFDPDWVASVLRRATAERTDQLCPGCRHARQVA